MLKGAFTLTLFMLVSVVSGFHAQENLVIPEERISYLINSAMGFEPNLGQLADREGNPVNNVRFFLKQPGFGIFVSDKGVSYVIYRTEVNEKEDGSLLEHFARIDIELVEGTIEDIEFEDETQGYTNYYLSHCPDGILHVKSYKKVRVKNLYEGVDWVFKLEDGVPHHEFEVEPGADVSKIRIQVKYADVELADGGRRAIFKTPQGTLEDGRIVAFEGNRKVNVNYVLDGNVLSFNVTDWSGSEKLIIDPPLSLLWGTYYSGSNYDFGHSITTDADGNVYVCGVTRSTDFPTFDAGGGAYYQGTRSGNYDGFIIKFTNEGVRLWATYYGGSDNDTLYSLATDSNGNLFVVGNTRSTNFPTYNPGGGVYYQGSLASSGYTDAVILKFNESGVREWATYYGGNYDDKALSCAVDNFGNLYVAGITFSDNLPTFNPGQGAYYQSNRGGSGDAFILKFDNTGILKWATYYGGGLSDVGYAITVDNYNNVFVTGSTMSSGFPLYNPGGDAYFQGSFGGGVADAYILKFDSLGVRLWATFYGGNDYDAGFSLKTDVEGNLFVTGTTYSSNFPVYNPGGESYFQGTSGGLYDVFLLKFNDIGMREWATYYGGSGWDYGYSIKIDSAGRVFVTGYTRSSDFPTFNPGNGAYYQGNYGGNTDVFLLGFSNIGVIEWATFYGGSQADEGYSLALDNQGNLFVTGYTYSSNFPTFYPGGDVYYQGSGQSFSAFILKFEGFTTTLEEDYTPSPLRIVSLNTLFRREIKVRFSKIPEKPVGIKIYDVLGNVIYSADIAPSTSLLVGDKEIESLPLGVYFLEIEAYNQKYTKRLLKIN